jgi:hypothetical protein
MFVVYFESDHIQCFARLAVWLLAKFEPLRDTYILLQEQFSHTATSSIVTAENLQRQLKIHLVSSLWRSAEERWAWCGYEVARDRR